MVVRRSNTSPAAGPLNTEDKFQFRCSARKGGIHENPRDSKNVQFKAKVSEGLGLTKVKVLSFLHRSLPSAQLISEDLKFKRSKGEPRRQHFVLTEESFPW